MSAASVARNSEIVMWKGSNIEDGVASNFGDSESKNNIDSGNDYVPEEAISIDNDSDNNRDMKLEF